MSFNWRVNSLPCGIYRTWTCIGLVENNGRKKWKSFLGKPKHLPPFDNHVTKTNERTNVVRNRIIAPASRCAIWNCSHEMKAMLAILAITFSCDISIFSNFCLVWHKTNYRKSSRIFHRSNLLFHKGQTICVMIKYIFWIWSMLKWNVHPPSYLNIHWYWSATNTLGEMS